MSLRVARLTSSESCEMNVLVQMNRITEPAAGHSGGSSL